MHTVTLKGNPIHVGGGEFPAVGSNFINATLTKTDLSRISLHDFWGSKIILNIFPSVDTGVCASSVRKFNQEAASLAGVKVLCISKDLPFAQSRFCGAEDIAGVIMLSDYVTGEFTKKYGVEIMDPPLLALCARSVIVIDAHGKIKYTEMVPEITTEPNYAKALEAVK